MQSVEPLTSSHSFINALLGAVRAINKKRQTIKQMKNFIYHDKNLRCRLKTTGYENQIELQLQKRFGFFWINVYKWMHVKEGFWGQCERFPILKNSYAYGNESECYMTGTLDLPKRVREFFQKYFNHLAIKEQGAKTVR